MADWKAGGHLEHHFRLHGHEVGARTIAEYDASAQETLRLGVIFSYWDRIAQERRVGSYHAATGRFVATDEDDLIVNHFVTGEAYVIGLEDSTYLDARDR